MTHQYYIRRLSCLLTIFLLQSAVVPLHAQWKQLAMPSVGIGQGTGGEGCIQFQQGVLWAGRNTLYSSNDSGATWTLCSTSFPAPVVDIQFFDKSNGFIATAAGLFITNDGGNSWKKIFASVGLDFVYISYKVAYGPSASILYAYDMMIGSFFATHDGGASWQETNLCQTDAISFTVSKTGVIYALANDIEATYTHGWIMSSSDQGASWQKHSAIVDGDCYTICADSTDDKTLYLLNEAYYAKADDIESNVYKSTDGGDSWVALTHDPPKSYTGAMCYTGHTFYAGREDLSIMRSTDNGANWKLCPAPKMSADGRTIACINDNTVLVLDSLGFVWKASYLCGDTLTVGLCLELSTADQKTDTIGGIVEVPIIIKGRSGQGNVELVIHYSPELEYIGTFSPKNISLDITGEQISGRSKLRASGVIGDTIGFAIFKVFADSAQKPIVRFDSLSEIGATSSCPLANFADSAISTITPPSGCGIGEIAGFMHYGTIPVVTISPNPVSTELIIHALDNIDDATITIINSIGNVVLSEHASLSKLSGHSISIASLPNGTYFVQIITSTSARCLQFVVLR